MSSRLGASLLATFAKVPDPRSPRGRRHPLPALLALSVAAMLEGARSLYAIYQWGRLQPPQVVHALGFSRDRTPTVSTLHLVFKDLDVVAFEAALGDWAQAYLGERGEAIAIPLCGIGPSSDSNGRAIDGKGLRGIHGEELPGVRLVAGYAVGAGLVLAQAGGQER
jgi:hypothetical protein